MPIFFARACQHIKRAPFFQYRKYELRDRLTVIFLLSGFVFSAIGFLLTLIFQQPLWMNTFNFLCMFICLVLPIIMIDRLIQASVVALFFVSTIYFPFIYFTTGRQQWPRAIIFRYDFGLSGLFFTGEPDFSSASSYPDHLLQHNHGFWIYALGVCNSIS